MQLEFHRTLLSLSNLFSASTDQMTIEGLNEEGRALLADPMYRPEILEAF